MANSPGMGRVGSANAEYSDTAHVDYEPEQVIRNTFHVAEEGHEPVSHTVPQVQTALVDEQRLEHKQRCLAKHFLCLRASQKRMKWHILLREVAVHVHDLNAVLCQYVPDRVLQLKHKKRDSNEGIAFQTR